MYKTAVQQLYFDSDTYICGITREYFQTAYLLCKNLLPWVHTLLFWWEIQCSSPLLSVADPMDQELYFLSMGLFTSGHAPSAHTRAIRLIIIIVVIVITVFC